MEPTTINIQSLVKEYDSKYPNDKLNVPKFQKYLSERNYSLNEFYFQVTNDLIHMIEILNNLINKDKNFFQKFSEEHKILFRIIEIINESNKLVQFNEETNKTINKNYQDIFEIVFNIFIKVNDVYEKVKNNKEKNYKEAINIFMNKMMIIIQIIFDKDYKCIEQCLEKKDNFDYLIEYDFTRKFLFDMLTMALKFQSHKNTGDVLNHKGSLNLINHILEYLIKVIKIDNIKDVYNDIKTIIKIYKDHIYLITNPILNLLIKLLELYNEKNQKIKVYYDDLFSFFFNDIIFEELPEPNYNSQFMGVVLELYKYLLEKNNKPLIDTFLIKLFFSVNMNMGIIKEELKSEWGKRYNWLLTQTDYMKVILDTFPMVFDEAIFAFYSGMLMNLVNAPKKQKCFLPEIDLVRFFGNLEKYLNNKNYVNKKDYLINIFTKKLTDLMNCNIEVVKIVLQKCNVFEVVIKLINNEKDNNIKIKLIELIEKMIAQNKEGYEYSFNIEIRRDMTDEINYRINIFTVGFEFDDGNYNKKISELINYMTEYSKSKKISEFIQISNFIFKIIIEYQFKKINVISEENLTNLNNLLLQMSVILSNPDANDLKLEEKDLNIIINSFLNSIFIFFIQFNLKKFNYKFTKNDIKNVIYYTKKIIEKKTMKYIIKNLLQSQNRIVKKKTLEYLLFISIDEKNNLIVSSYFIYIITKIYYQDKNYKGIQKLFDMILNLIKKFEINAKILLYYDFVSIILNILQELYGKENEYEEYYKSTFIFLEEIVKYLSQNLLMTYLNKVFVLFNKNILSQIKEQEPLENNDWEMLTNENKRENVHDTPDIFDLENINEETDNINKEEKNDINDINEEPEKEVKKSDNELCFKLLNLLKNTIQNNYMNENYLILSNYTFHNHWINNILFFENLFFNITKDTLIEFRLTLKLNSYKGINDFLLLQLINQKNKINFTIKNSSLEVKEISGNKETILIVINNFDKMLPADNKYHNVILNFDVEKKLFSGVGVDDNKIIKQSSGYNNFNFNQFSAIIGFDYNNVKSNENDMKNKLKNLENINNKDNNIESNENNDDVCFVYISNFFVFNTLIEEKNLLSIFQKEKKLTNNQNLLNYLYRIGYLNLGKNVITEMNFESKYMHLLKAKDIKNRLIELNKFFYLLTNVFINRYISSIKVLNNCNADCPITYMYIISKNNNINDFCALNAFWELENINKFNLNSKLFDNYNLKKNCVETNFIDFFFGFLFLIEKRFDDIKNKKKEKEGKFYEIDDNDNEEVGMELYGETYLTNDNIVLEYILEIFEIIFLSPPLILEKYFNEKNILKLKFFIYRNVSLFKNDEEFVEKLLKIFSKNEIILMLFISNVFFDINIFSKLDSTFQNIIINYLIEFLSKLDIKIEIIHNKEIFNNIFPKLIKSIINIIFFTNLPTYKNEEDKTHLDLLINCIEIIISKISIYQNDEMEIKIKNFFYSVNNICKDFEEKMKKHLTQEIYNKFNYIYSDESDFYEGYFEEKMNKLAIQINSFYKLFNQNANVMSFMKNYEEKNNKENECSFCNYVKILFHQKSKFLYDEYNYIKIFNRFFRNYFQNFGNDPDIFDKNVYYWFLSLKESNEKMQNKFFLKENKIKHFYYGNQNCKVKTLYFKYMIDEENNKHKFKEMNKLYFYDQICCKEENLIKQMNPHLETVSYYNCLIINKLNKILSTFVLYKDRIEIYFFICIDTFNKIHIVKNLITPHILWMKTQNEFKNELDKYITENENKIKQEIYSDEKKEVNKNKKPNLSSFNYTKNVKFSRKILHLTKINEIYKRDHLHLPNALEIFLNNGENYFIVFNPEIRELLFDQIISNIDEIYKANPENKISIFNSPKIQALTNRENIFYMKHTPMNLLSQSDLEHFLKNHKKKKYYLTKSNHKSILDINTIKEELCLSWSKNKINNYDYLMLLNTLSGRTLNDLSQYFIFPWIIKDFDKDILNWLSSSIYRDLSLPIYACGGDIEKIKTKFELDDEKYHSGVFYSAHSFVCYFLVRVHPFTEMHLDIQGARFDARNRMFNGAEQLSNIAGKVQELIPQLFYCPELFVKLNYYIEDINQDEEILSDFELPSWSKDDPRKFSLILNKLLENKNISKNLNQWIDLIFGYQQIGPNAEKALNTFRESTYPLSKTDLENMEKDGSLENYLYEKEELGCIGKQLFIKPHKSRDIVNENIKNKKIFFNSDEKIKKLNIYKIKEEIKLFKSSTFQKYNDIFFPDYNLKPQSYYQGGISSLKSLMNFSEDPNLKIAKKKLVEKISKEEKFFILKKNYFFLSKYCLILTYKKGSLQVINIKKKETKFFLLSENAEISCLTINSKGTKIFVGFSNGLINIYKITNELIINNEKLLNSNYCKEIQHVLDNNAKVYNDVFINNYNFFLKDELDNSNIHIRKIVENNFNENNPHKYQRLNIIALNESHNVLISLDQTNIIYIMSLNNNCKLMHKNIYLTKTQYKYKEIIPLEQNGDFVIYSSYSVHLFSINGVPLCSLNVFDKIYDKLFSITCCRAVFIYDVILFTAHKDGTIIIWKVINKDLNDIDNDLPKNKIFMKEYLFNYNYRDCANVSIKLGQNELRRQFEEILIKQLHTHKKSKMISSYVTFMKMSIDMDYMILIDNEKNLYILTNSEPPEQRKITIVGKNKFKQQQVCMNCGNELIDIGIRPSLIMTRTFSSYDVESSEHYNSLSFQKSDNNNQKVICEECEQKLKHTENFLYTY